jgi:hypothetical protein
MSKRHPQNGKADVPAIKAGPLGDLHYPARSAPPIPDVLYVAACLRRAADLRNFHHNSSGQLDDVRCDPPSCSRRTLVF